MSDKKLVDAMALIRGILEGADIAGFIILHNAPGELETYSHISPSYSVARFQESPQGVGIRIRSQKADYADDPAKQNWDMEATVSMLSGFGEIMGINAMRFLETVEAVKKAMPGMIEQTPLHRTDNDRQSTDGKP